MFRILLRTYFCVALVSLLPLRVLHAERQGSRYRINDGTIDRLRNVQVTEAVLSKLQLLENVTILGEKDFSNKLKEILDNDTEFNRYRNLILEYANLSNVNTSFYIISAIKTISGEEPDTEFFDANLKFKFRSTVFALAGIDIALSRVGTDSVSSPARELTEAGASLNWGPIITSDGRRQPFLGFQLKIFDAVPYAGVHVGSIELNPSDFFTSYFTVGYLRRFFRSDPAEESVGYIQEFRDNFYCEFGIRSDKVAVIDALRIKGGILVPSPFKYHEPRPSAHDVKTRIVIEIPIQGVHSF